MHTRYLLALALLPAFATTARAQGPLTPPPPPPGTEPPPAPAQPPTAPTPAPTPPAPATPSTTVTTSKVDEPMAPSFASGADATLAATPDVVNGVPPRVAGADASATLDGPAGLLRVSSAEVGAPLHLRVGLSGQFFQASNFLIDCDRDTRLGGALSMGFTPIRYLEVFGAVSGTANRNLRRPGQTDDTGRACAVEAMRNDPEVIKSYGDLALGTKFAYPLSGGVSAGAELGLRFLSSVSGLSFNSKATSVWLSGLSTWDLRQNVNVPVRLHFNLGLYFDNSDEVQNYQGVTRPSKAVSEFAYGIARDRVRGALGAEWVIDQLGQDWPIRAFAEYHLEMVTGSADPAFSDFTSPVCKANADESKGETPCRDNRDQQWATLGARAQLKGTIWLTAAVDIALHSVGFPYGPPLPPYQMTLGVGYPFDLGAPRYIPRTVVVERRIPAEKAPEGFVAGKVLAAPTNTPVEGAIVSIAGRPKSRVATDPDGTFKTAALPVGVFDVEVTAPGFQAASVRTSVAAGLEAPVAVTLTPKVKNGKVTGKVTDAAGKAVAATLHFVGPQNVDVKADDSGAFSTTLPGGSYSVRIEADKFFAKELKVDVADGQEQDASVSIKAKPTATHVTVQNGKLTVRHAFAFKGAGPTLDVAPASAAVLDELADVLISHPEIKKVRIEAHWDSSLPKEQAQALTDRQAKAIAAYLTKQGVNADRIEVAGLGAQRPIVPNIGMAKLRNRRVEIRAIN